MYHKKCSFLTIFYKVYLLIIGIIETNHTHVNKTGPMQDKYTQLDLVKLLYMETSAADTLDMYEELEKNEALASDFEALKAARDLLPDVLFSPSTRTIQSILGYSDQHTLV